MPKINKYDSPHVGENYSFLHTFIDSSNEAIDISSADSMTLDMLSPTGVIKSGVLLFVGDGTDGETIYTTLTTDLDEEGFWIFQFVVEETDVYKYISNALRQYVYGTL